MKILYFAGAQEAAGLHAETWEAAALSLDEFWSRAIERHPRLAEIRPACMVAVNSRLVRDPAATIGTADEVAVMTAFSGG